MCPCCLSYASQPASKPTSISSDAYYFHVNGSIGIVQKIDFEIRPDLGCTTPKTSRKVVLDNPSVCLSGRLSVLLSLFPRALTGVFYSSSGSGSRDAGHHRPGGHGPGGGAGRGGNGAGVPAAAGIVSTPQMWLASKLRWLFVCVHRDPVTRPRSDQYAYQIAEIQQKQHKRASSVSSSENFSSSRSDSWRQHQHNCGIPMRLLDPKRRASSWLVTRKTSQDSNLSSSRNDSSGSATTASTSTWRISRSSASSGGCSAPVPPPQPIAPVDCPSAISRPRVKPRLIRQSAVHEDFGDVPGSPGRLTVRFLTTIPSAAETSVQNDDENSTAADPTSPLLDGGGAGGGGGATARRPSIQLKPMDQSEAGSSGVTTSLLRRNSHPASAPSPRS